MRRLFAWLGAASLVVLWSVSTHAAPGNALKPYVVLILDTSGSMTGSTGSGPPSCGGADTKINHARCAINNIVNSYGDIVFAFAKFHMNGAGSATNCPANCTLAQDACTQNSDRFQLNTALVDGNNAEAALWADFSCNTCSQNAPVSGTTNPEVWTAAGNTPLEGVLHGDKCYWQGLNAFGTDCSATQGTSLWGSTTPGFAPIANDPTKDVFLGPPNCDPSATCTTNCCTSQCRPYITILLTDGDETCGGTDGQGACSTSGATCFLDTDCPSGQTCVGAGTVDQAAASLLTTVVGGKKYRIKTNPIAFGNFTPPYGPIENIAHAGGNVNGPGNEGFYARDEAGLELAISQIIEGSIRTEVCNNLDDDCDTQIDEDFPNKGQACDNGKLGACKRPGTYVCKADGTGTVCNAPDATGTPEICNGIDDDCNGLVDDGLQNCNCSATAEVCNGKDDDCNGVVDNGVPPKACAITNGFGSCPGTEACAGTVGCDPATNCYGACIGQTPAAEICDGKDNNCDGVCDGFNQACSNMPPVSGNPAGDPRNNPGDALNNPIPQNVCHPGQQNCPSFCGSSNTFGACQGEVQGCNPLQNPGIHCDVCNGLDDDCDNKIDEDFQSAACSTNCGVGVTKCTNGQITCDAQAAGSDTTCDGVDDDCDGSIDEDWVCDPSPTCVGPNCCKCGNGTSCEQNKCVAGHVTCVATQPIGPEQCNCLDDDCDGTVDEDTTCGNGGQCVQCQCAFQCSPGEFPCPLGDKCVNNFCVADPCYNKQCPAQGGIAQVCQPQPGDPTQPECVAACSVTTCPSPLICVPATGDCKPNDCTTFPDMCAANQTCVVDPNTGTASCVSNPCSGVSCPSGQYCSGGNCVGSCADVTCPSGQRCRLGVCEADPCGHPCPFGQVCDDASGMCHPDPCQFRQCPQGDWCNPNDGQCEADPCVGTMCPSPDQICKGGTCYNPDQFLPDAGAEAHVTVGGGGCNTTGGDATWLLGLALLLAPRVRRRRQGGAQ